VYRYRHQLRAVGVVALILLIIIGVIIWTSHRTKVKVTDFNSCIMAGYDASNSDPQTCSDGHRTYVAPSSSAATTGPSAPSETAQQYTVLVQGDTKGSYPARQQVVTTEAAWSALWGQLYSQVKPFPPLLPVDFSHNEVVVLTDGMEPSGGYALDVTGVSAGSDSATVYYTQTSPASSCKAPIGPTDPLEAVVTAKTTGQVAYKMTSQTSKC